MGEPGIILTNVTLQPLQDLQVACQLSRHFAHVLGLELAHLVLLAREIFAGCFQLRLRRQGRDFLHLKGSLISKTERPFPRVIKLREKEYIAAAHHRVFFENANDAI